jgi:hypothetical protein
VQLIVVAPIVKVLFESPADDEPTIFIHRDVSQVEELVDVGAQQQAIRALVETAVCIGPDMCCVEDRERSFAAYGAAPLIGVRDQQAERPLPEPRANKARFAEALDRGRHRRPARSLALGDRIPEAKSLGLFRVVPLPAYRL